MRQILVQRARARNAIKRGGGPQRVTLDDANLAANDLEAGGVEAASGGLHPRPMTSTSLRSTKRWGGWHR